MQGYLLIMLHFDFWYNLQEIIFSQACVVDLGDGDQFVITGGKDRKGVTNKVTLFTAAETSIPAPSLNTGRRGHGCAKYIGSNQEQVSQHEYQVGYFGPSAHYGHYLGSGGGWWTRWSRSKE